MHTYLYLASSYWSSRPEEGLLLRRDTPHAPQLDIKKELHWAHGAHKAMVSASLRDTNPLHSVWEPLCGAYSVSPVRSLGDLSTVARVVIIGLSSS